MISLNLRDSATEMEKPAHPSHEAWFKSLAILRDLFVGVDSPIGGRRYCCVDQDDPRQAFYLYREAICFMNLILVYLISLLTVEKCSDEGFKAIKATCTSEASELSRQLSILLKQRLSKDSI